MTTAWREGPWRAGAFPLCVSAVLGAVLLAPACSRPRDASRSLSQTFESPLRLAEAVLDGLARRDVAALEGLPLTETEFRTVIWPELPSSRPAVNLPVDYAWRDLHYKNRGHLNALVQRVGGRRLTLVRVEFAGDTTSYETFVVRRKTVVVARDGGGTEQRLRLFGSILERRGRFKLFSYVVD